MNKIKFKFNLININNIAISDKVKNGEISNYIIGYLNNIDEINSLGVILLVILNIVRMVERICHVKLKIRVFI